MKHLEVEYKALRISGCNGNAGKPLHMEQQSCVFYPPQPLCCSYQKYSDPCKMLSIELAKTTLSKEKCFVKYPVIQRGVCLDLLTSSPGNVSRDFPNRHRASASTCKGTAPSFGFPQTRYPRTELKMLLVCCC